MQYINNHIIKEQYITQNTIYLKFLNLKQQTLNFLNKLIQQFKVYDLLIFIQTNFESIYSVIYFIIKRPLNLPGQGFSFKNRGRARS